MDNGLPTSIQFASYILHCAQNRNLVSNLTKIQKWTYISYGLHLAVFQGKNCLFEEKPYCWPHGPVFPEIFYMQKDHPDIFIQEYTNYNFEHYIPLADFVFSKWGNWSATALSEWTHQKNTAWEKASRKNPYTPHRVALDSKDIYEDFKEYVKRA